uniref:NADH-ubiquinone oxidoreductase chain 5 n=1 Tax=Sclerophasma paresisense TaxID=253126 RepID=Q2Q1I8_9NEOP|nr:NADH dehydrogenase subunit 5 [Sclerophasma paresisense]ABB81898.1 NADH dehydrogenase subunit 5 [Sclerophasma paresisense]
MMFKYSLCKILFFYLFISSFILIMTSIYFLLNHLIYIIEWEIITINSNLIMMSLLIDWMSLIFMGFVFFISSLVILYSNDYMMGDLNINRFILIVFLFVISMMFLILSPNLISILLGWDGLGLVSYCLVIYYQNVKSYNAGMLTVLSNRLGDVALLMAIAWMFNYGGWNYYMYMDFTMNHFEMIIVGSLIIFASMTKSAQIPFSSWLPAAMAAPTPVSALVHSSTLVTAGVYLLIRFNSILYNSSMCMFLLLIGGLTMFMAGLGANFEYDLKKIIALSTLSQLGLMIMTLSLGFTLLSFFHLLTHALFKALLFMCAGIIIHNMKDSQDIRFMGGLINHLPLTVTCFIVSNMALCGMPFMAGFYSKDLILELSSTSYLNMIIYFMFYFSTGLTVCYTLRLCYYLTMKDFNVYSFHPLYDSFSYMSKSMIGLVIMSIIGGSILSWFIFPSPQLIVLPLYLKFMTLSVCFLGGWIGYNLNYILIKHYYFSNFGYFSKKMFGSMWFMPFISTHLLVNNPLFLGYYSIKSLDFGWNEYFGGQGISKMFLTTSGFNQFIQNNDLKFYLLSVTLWFIILLIIL